MMTNIAQTLDTMTEAQTLDEQTHVGWVAPEAKSDIDRLVNAINALNHSWDKRLDRLTDAVLLLVKVIERRQDRY